jgi:hydroxymethylglutaryl-CoA reductase
MSANIWSGFYKKSIAERKQQLRYSFPKLFVKDDPFSPLEEDTANQMIENCIGCASLPFGLGLNFNINAQNYVVPMVVEEPSVVAAVSGNP